MAGPVTAEVRAMDPGVPIYSVRTMDELLSHSLARRRLAMATIGAFAAFALILAAVGVYGVISYLVSQGTREIGIRMALGAGTRTILGLVVKQGMGLAAVGIVLGLGGALALTHLMSKLLYGVSARDTITFGVTAVLLAIVAFAASIIPARRAASVDPIEALRFE
jgi:ABC-type antimicrobial peptide transport system permease subunit